MSKRFEIPALSYPNVRIEPFNFSKIDPYVYIGTTIATRAHFEKLLALGMKADIDLQEEKIDKPSGVASFLWLPTADFTPPSQVQLIIGSHFIEDMVRHHMHCYIHCNAGNGRAPTLAAAYYILARRMTPQQAVRHIQAHRPSACPNRSQMRALDTFYKSIHHNQAS
ncbi:MAG: dual specificity protein phosphatase family protein [Candidatus Kerfeldbacteria bacterium]|nr:dual specificity protein phosphatase family protein [Candidatus Kerfeldbacteria bacterium]